jgi:hypothetical protein
MTPDFWQRSKSRECSRLQNVARKEWEGDVLVDKTMLLKHVEKQKKHSHETNWNKGMKLNRINLSTSLFFVWDLTEAISLLYITFPISLNVVNMTIVGHLCSKIILQKSFTVLGFGPKKTKDMMNVMKKRDGKNWQ